MYSALLSLHVLAGVATLACVALIVFRARPTHGVASRFASLPSLAYLAAFQIITGTTLALFSHITALSLCDNLLAYSILVGTGIIATLKQGESWETKSLHSLIGSAALFVGAVVLGA